MDSQDSQLLSPSPGLHTQIGHQRGFPHKLQHQPAKIQRKAQIFSNAHYTSIQPHPQNHFLEWHREWLGKSEFALVKGSLFTLKCSKASSFQMNFNCITYY